MGEAQTVPDGTIFRRPPVPTWLSLPLKSLPLSHKSGNSVSTWAHRDTSGHYTPLARLTVTSAKLYPLSASSCVYHVVVVSGPNCKTLAHIVKWISGWVYKCILSCTVVQKIFLRLDSFRLFNLRVHFQTVFLGGCITWHYRWQFQDISRCSTSTPALSIFILFNFSSSRMYVEVTHCSFNLHFIIE